MLFLTVYYVMSLTVLKFGRRPEHQASLGTDEPNKS